MASAPSVTPRPARTSPPVGLLWAPMAAGAALAVAVLAQAAPEGGSQLSQPILDLAPAAPSPAPAWRPAPDLRPLLVLDGPDGRGIAGEVRVGEGGAREETLSAALSDGLHLRLQAWRGVPGAMPSSFYVELVRRAAEAGLAVERSAPPAPLNVRLGSAEAGSATLNGESCLVLRFAHPEAAFRLHGWLCRPGEAPRPRELACVVDRLALAPGRDDPVLRVTFAQAARRTAAACAEP